MNLKGDEAARRHVVNEVGSRYTVDPDADDVANALQPRMIPIARLVRLLGFGGDAKSGRSLVVEVTAAVLLDRHWAIGYEYRQKPDNLAFAREDDWQDLFVAWFPSKHVSLVAAWADLGSIATLRDQTGWYLSLQVSL